MDLGRLKREIDDAGERFAFVEARPTNAGGLGVRLALQPVPGSIYTFDISFPDAYPNQMPSATMRRPGLRPGSPHVYRDNDSICYLHPLLWNPGRHDLAFVIGRLAKWAGKYEVWRHTHRWPGAELAA